MDKKVFVSVIGHQEVDGDVDTVELVTEGRFEQSGAMTRISYMEDDMTGHGQSETVVTVEGKTVTMTRSGDTNAMMVFEKGRRHLGHYDTEFGGFTVGVSSQKVKIDLGERGGDIAINYILDINNIARTRNDLTLHIKEA